MLAEKKVVLQLASTLVFIFCFTTNFIADTSHAQLISFGAGNIFYQVNFYEWLNPDGKTYTGANCDTIGGRCDTKFQAHVQAITRDDPRRSPVEFSWPGPKAIEKWQTVGKRKYEENSLKNFANLTLDGVQADGFREALIRVQVLDVDNLRNDIIGEFVGRLPGLQDLQIGFMEYESQWSRPIQLHPLSSMLPGVQEEKADPEQVRKHRLVVRVRAWGATPRESPMARRYAARPNNGGNDDSAAYYRDQQQRQRDRQLRA